MIFLRFAQTQATESEVYREQRDRGRAGFLYCQEGTPGVEFYVRITPAAGEAIVTKHRYSGFINTDLELILRSSSIRTLVMTGVATNGCVDATGRRVHARLLHRLYGGQHGDVLARTARRDAPDCSRLLRSGRHLR